MKRQRLRSCRKSFGACAMKGFGLIIVSHVVLVEAWFEYCTPNGIYAISAKDCPFGVLWKNPQDIGNCWYPQGGDHMSNVCQEERDPDGTRKIQWIDTGLDDEEGPTLSSYSADSCKNMEGSDRDDPPDDKCSGDYIPVTKDNTIGGDDALDVDGNSNRDDNDTDVDRTNVDVRNQTLRLFLYMNELLVDENENLPVIRLVKLLKKSFEVLRTHCQTKYVSGEFSKEVLKAFLFLLRESDLAHVKDISVTEYAKINAVLERCVKGKPPFPFYLNGTVCKAHTKINNIVKTWGGEDNVQKHNKTHAFVKSNEFSFKWGRYDIPVDATWSVMDFTHGMCYGTFSADMNSHHLYEQALERLFTNELKYRWVRPVRLTNEFFWDNVFRSYTETAMANLDACIQASYLGSPYLHRLSRPISRETHNKRRRKRNADSLGQSAYCLTSQDEKDEAMKVIKDAC